jgi:biofilm PGA synthesis N-glycosyltransferase PgaC
MLAARLVFWTSLLFVAYTYVGYPLLLALRRSLHGRPVARRSTQPTLSLVVAVYNEAERIEAKLRNLLSLDYPRSQLQILVALDGCTDHSERIVRRFAGEGVEAVRLHTHAGKAVAINAAVARARGEIVVFADVRQRVAPDALQALADCFGDPTVGVVTGELVLADERGAEATDAVGAYWRYEKAIRAWESDLHSVVGATGALYAIRRELIPELPAGTILDDVLIPMHAVLRGARCVFEPRARIFDRTPCCAAVEYRRKVRTLAGNFQLLCLAPALLHPGRNPIWLQFMSHKVARLFVPYALLTLLASNLFLAGPVYAFFLAAQVAFYALALFGAGVELLEAGADIEPVEVRSEAS